MPYNSSRGTFHICDPKPHRSTGILLEVKVSAISNNSLLSIIDADSPMEQTYIVPHLLDSILSYVVLYNMVFKGKVTYMFRHACPPTNPFCYIKMRVTKPSIPIRTAAAPHRLRHMVIKVNINPTGANGVC
jgi:hypothetical protein